MANKAPRSSITAIHEDLTFSQRDVYLWVKLSPNHYEFQTESAREQIAENQSLALANILNSEENELGCQLIVTSKVFDVNQWRNGYLEQTAYASPVEYFGDYTMEMGNHIYAYQFRDKNVYLGVNLGYRTDFSPTKSIFKVKAIDDLITRLTGEVDEYISEKELAFWEDKARLVRFSLLDEGGVQAQTVRGVELAYIIRKNLFPAMESPSIDDLSIAGTQRWGAGELATLADGDVENKAKWLEITQEIDGKTQKGYRATLCFVKFPEVMRYPEREPWIHSASQLGFPVDINSRFSIVPSKKVKKQVGNKIKAIQDQATNMTSAGGELSIEVRENYQLGQYLDYALSKDDTPWLYGRHRIAVEASTEDQLKERCQAVIDHYKRMGILVVWSSGDQLDLLLEGMPSDRVRLSSYYQRHELGIIGAGVPAGSGGAGDLPEQKPDGSISGWLGPYIGYTTSRVTDPVFLSLHSALAKDNPPGLVITGSPGSGKSFTAFTLTYNMVLSGVKTIYIDPKMDALPLKTLPGCEDAMIVDLREGHDGLLDPFQLGETDGERIDLVLDTIKMLIGDKLTSIAEAELSKSIKIVLKDRYPSMNKLTEVLLNSRIPDAAALGERLSIIRKLPFARLCFSTISRGNEIPHLTLDSRLTIITLLGLEMPSSLTPKSSYSTRNQLAVAVLFLLTSFTRRLMISNEIEKYLPKAIVIDEAWAITSTDQGAKMVLEVARMGRSLNTVIVLVSQNAGDFLGENVTNSVSVKMAFRTKNEAEIDNVLSFFALPKDAPHRKVIRELNRGECLIQDADGRVALVRIDNWNAKMSIAFETNPVAKRKNAEQNSYEDA